MLKRKQTAGGPIKLTSGDRLFYAVNTVLLALLAAKELRSPSGKFSRS
mgnify:CR=1 FL=1